MLDQIEEQVYYSLIGEMEEEYRLPWVEDAFREGSPCDRAYLHAMEAAERLCTRLGAEDSDADVETILNSMLDIQKELCLKMFRCGVQYGQ